MLRDTASQMCMAPQMPSNYEERYKRNEKKDLKRAMDLFFKLKENLDKLHPACAQVVYNLVNTRGL
jgi:hypothetical protein